MPLLHVSLAGGQVNWLESMKLIYVGPS